MKYIFLCIWYFPSFFIYFALRLNKTAIWRSGIVGVIFSDEDYRFDFWSL
jgi:hypothetical protein